MTITGSRRGTFAAMYEASKDLSLDGNPRQVRLDALEVMPNQPRRIFDDEALDELAESVRSHGVLQPLLVRVIAGSTPTRYQIVAGERRFRAAKMAALTSVPVVIKSLSDQAALEVALIENLQREDISPLEEAQTLKQILDASEMSHRELGERIGKTKAYVEQRVRMLRYPEDVRHALTHPLEGQTAFSPGHAKAVVQIDEPALREAFIAVIQECGLSVREAEKRVGQLKHLTAETALSPERQASLRRVILSRTGIDDERLARQLQGPGEARTAPGIPDTVDLRKLAIAQRVIAALSSEEWLIDGAELSGLLRQDLRALALPGVSGRDQ